jgi:hypothetical protein
MATQQIFHATDMPLANLGKRLNTVVCGGSIMQQVDTLFLMPDDDALL